MARAVGLLGVMYGALIGGRVALGTFAFAASAGVRFRPGVGFVGLLYGRISLQSGGSIQLYSLGPGVRFGNRSQITVAFVPTISAASFGTLSSTVLLATILVQAAVAIGDYFTLFIQPAVDFSASGAVGAITGGIGITF